MDVPIDAAACSAQPLTAPSNRLCYTHMQCVRVCPQVAYHASRALLQYIRAHLLIHLTALQRRLRDGPVRTCTTYLFQAYATWQQDGSASEPLCASTACGSTHRLACMHTHARTPRLPPPRHTHTAGPAHHTSDRIFVTPATVERLCWRADAAVLCCAVSDCPCRPHLLPRSLTSPSTPVQQRWRS